MAGRHVFGRAEFWLGLAYVSFPLGVLIYGWNDIVDYETDRFNPRKGTFLFGARGTPQRLARLPRQMDLEPDRRAGRRTLAEVLHAVPAKWLLSGLLAVEAALIWTCARELWLAGFLAAGAGWFLLDAMLLWGDRAYSPRAMRLLFLGWNAVALASLPLIWHATSLAPLR